MAIELVLAHPERVHTLVLAATHCGVSTSSTRPGTPCPRASLGGRSTRPASPTSIPNTSPRTSASGRQPRHPQGGRRQWEAMQAFDAHDRLPAIEVPTLVLHGTEDRMVASENAELIASRIPGAELVLLHGAGHLYHSERAEEADDAVLDFVRRHRRWWRPGARGARDRGAAAARADKDFATADALRDELAAAGWTVVDDVDGEWHLDPVVDPGPPRGGLRAADVPSVLDASTRRRACTGSSRAGPTMSRDRSRRSEHRGRRRVRYVVADVTGTDPSAFGDDVVIRWRRARVGGRR